MASTNNQNLILNDTNYAMWETKMKIFFFKNLNCWEEILTKYEELEVENLAIMISSQRNVLVERKKID